MEGRESLYKPSKVVMQIFHSHGLGLPEWDDRHPTGQPSRKWLHSNKHNQVQVELLKYYMGGMDSDSRTRAKETIGILESRYGYND